MLGSGANSPRVLTRHTRDSFLRGLHVRAEVAARLPRRAHGSIEQELTIPVHSPQHPRSASSCFQRYVVLTAPR